jgi:hypothetical protein
MEDFDMLLEKLKSLEIIQKKGDWIEDIPQELYDTYFEPSETIEEETLTEKHRWYETAITVLKIFNRYLGIRYVSDLYSESMSYEDCFHTLKFFEVEPIQITSYKIKK